MANEEKKFSAPIEAKNPETAKAADPKPIQTVEVKKPEEKSAPITEPKKPEPAKAADPKPIPTVEVKKPEEKSAPAAEPKKPEPAKAADPKAAQTAEAKKPDAEKTAESKKDKAEEKSVGPAAAGPAGVAITQVLKDKLLPPSDKDIAELPLPKDGEAFFAVLHPKYLVNSDLNRFSVDTTSDNFKELLKSIEQNGIKEPVKARPKKDGKGIEIVSGQRRHIAATMLGYPVPTIIERIDDEDAKIQIADGNLHRDKISSYDLSRSLRMKMEAMKQKAGRRGKRDRSMPKLDTDEAIAREMGISVPKLNRIIRLSEADKVICDRVDDGSLALSIASAISFLKPETQVKVSDLMDINYKVTTDRIERMKKVEKGGKLTDSMMRDILEDKDLIPKAPPAPVTHSAPSVTIKPVTPGVESISTPTPVAPPVTPPVAPVIPKSPDVAAPVAPTMPTPAVATVTPAVGEAKPAAPEAETGDVFKGEQERPQSTKIILAGDRLRRYFPDVEMTPREIEESIYDALEERRRRQEKDKEKATHKFTR